VSNIPLIDRQFYHPTSGEKIIFDESQKKFLLNKNSYFENFNDIPDLFIDDNKDLTSIQSEFYNEIKFPNYDNIDDFGSLIDKASKSIFAKKLDEEIPTGSCVLEAGCGTGQMSLYLSRRNRKIYGIDLSKGSLIEAEKFRKKNEIKNVYFQRMNIFNLCFKNNFFDVIISNGVLHHTHTPELAFNKLVKVLKKDGLIVIGLYHKYGRLVTKLRQKLISIFGEKMMFTDPRFKRSNISDQKKYAWFLDQYKNPSETVHTVSEILGWFEKNSLEFISSIPFDFQVNKSLFEKNEIPSKLKLNIKEITQMFSSSQIEEGGFFIMIGKKK
jgi:ubiquinone/menaquinone biosynthesis C-methylase UbiE